MIRGQVYMMTERGRAGVGDVLVSNGEAVVSTGVDGRYELPAPEPRGHIFVTVPSGYTAITPFFQATDPENPDPVDFGLRQTPETADPDYTFVVLADYQVELGDLFAQQVRRIAADPARPRFIVHVGDLFTETDGATLAQAVRLYRAYAETLGQMPLPIYNAIGNHDQLWINPRVPPGSEGFGNGVYEMVLGPTYYAFDYGQVHNIVLNCLVLKGRQQHWRLGERQLAWLRNDLAHQPKERPVIFFVHMPPVRWENKEEFLAALAGHNVRLCFVGDWHRNWGGQWEGETFPTIISASPTISFGADPLPLGYRLVEVHGAEVRHIFRVWGHDTPLLFLYPADGARLDGQVGVRACCYHWSDDEVALDYQVDGGDRRPMSRERGRDPKLAETANRFYQAWLATWDAGQVAYGRHTLTLHAVGGRGDTWQEQVTVVRAPSPAAWQFQLETPDTAEPVYADGLVYVGSAGGHVYALDGASGRALWRAVLPGRVMAEPAVGGDLLFVACSQGIETAIATEHEDGCLYALDRSSGRVVWSRLLGGMVCAGPVVDSGRVYIGNFHLSPGQGALLALRAADGAELWRYEPGHVFYDRPLVRDGVLYCGTLICGSVVALDTDTGRPRWVHETDLPGVIGSPVIVDGVLYVAEKHGIIYGFDLASGELLSSYFVSPGTDLTPGPGMIFLGSGFFGLWAFEPRSGRRLWNFRSGQAHFIRSGALRDGTLYVGSSDQNFYALEAATGHVRWSYRIGNACSAKVTLGDHLAYVVPRDGRLWAIRLP